MVTSLIRFHTEDNLRLDGLLFEPDKKTNKVIIHVHGTSSDFYRTRYTEDFADALTKKGYSFLTFNNRGCGFYYNFFKEEEGKQSKRVVIGSLCEVFEDCILDIQAAIDFAKSKGYSEIVLQGHSYGCNKVMWFTINKGFKDKIILLAPCDIAKHKYGRFARVARDLSTIDMFRYKTKTVMPEIQKIKNDILVQMGTIDEYVDQPDKNECIKYLQKAFHKSKLTANLIEGANHNYDGKYSELVANVTKWLP